MAKRREFVEKLSALFDEGLFVYAGYNEKPSKLPHGMYLELPADWIYADNVPLIKKRNYVVQIVTAHKDWDLEDKVEDTFDSLEVPYRKVLDEPFKDEKVHVVRYECVVID